MNYLVIVNDAHFRNKMPILFDENIPNRNYKLKVPNFKL